MTALAASAAAINATLRLDEVLQRILNETIQALQVETVALALVEANWDLVFRAATGRTQDGIVGKQIPAGQGIVGWVVHEGEGVVIPAVKRGQAFPAGVEHFEGLVRACHGRGPDPCPGTGHRHPGGHQPHLGVFDPDALLVLAGIGNLAGSTIQHAQLFERLQAAHKRYRELFDDSVDPILITDWDGKIHEANRQAAVISGYTSSQLQGMMIDQLHEAVRSRSKGQHGETQGRQDRQL